jgi:hypothetical protein
MAQEGKYFSRMACLTRETRFMCCSVSVEVSATFFAFYSLYNNTGLTETVKSKTCPEIVQLCSISFARDLSAFVPDSPMEFRYDEAALRGMR